MLSACGGITTPVIDPPVIDPPVGDTFGCKPLVNLHCRSDESLAELPSQAVDVWNAFQAANGLKKVTTSMPMGDATYNGTFAIGSHGWNVPTLAGDVDLIVNFQNLTANGSAKNITAYGDDNVELPVIGTLAIVGETPENELVAVVNGDLIVDGYTHTLEGEMNGSFTGAVAEGGFGRSVGVVTNPDDSTDYFGGLYVISR